MTEIRTEIEIDACADRVWQVLTDFAAYPEWNPVVRTVRGEAKAGVRLEVRIQPRDGIGLTFQPTVLAAEPGRELRWQGRLWISGLFSGEHTFSIEPLENSRVRFIQREVFTGLLVPLIMLIFKASTRRVFEYMNRALKARAEQSPAP